MFAFMDRWTEREMDGEIDEDIAFMDRWMDGLMHRWIDGWTDIWIDG